MGYDTRAALVTKLESIRTALDKARVATVTRGGDSETQRSYKLLLEEERDVLRQINALDCRATGGASNRVAFGRPS